MYPNHKSDILSYSQVLQLLKGMGLHKVYPPAKSQEPCWEFCIQHHHSNNYHSVVTSRIIQPLSHLLSGRSQRPGVE